MQEVQERFCKKLLPEKKWLNIYLFLFVCFSLGTTGLSSRTSLLENTVTRKINVLSSSLGYVVRLV